MRAKVGPNTTVPVANGKTAPATSFQPSGAQSNPGRKPNQSLVTPTIATPSGVDAQNNVHGQPTTRLDSEDLGAGGPYPK